MKTTLMMRTAAERGCPMNKNEGGQWKYSLGGIRGNNILQEILNNMAERMVDLSENFAEKMQ